jgi:hypothetical protein
MASVSSRKRQPILLLWSNRTLSLNLEASLGTPLAGPRRGRREGVEVQRQLHVLDRIPQRLPDRVPHRLHVPRAGEFEAFQPRFATLCTSFTARSAIGQARKTDLAVRVVAAASTSDDTSAPKNEPARAGGTTGCGRRVFGEVMRGSA